MTFNAKKSASTKTVKSRVGVNRAKKTFSQGLVKNRSQRPTFQSLPKQTVKSATKRSENGLIPPPLLMRGDNSSSNASQQSIERVIAQCFKSPQHDSSLANIMTLPNTVESKAEDLSHIMTVSEYNPAHYSVKDGHLLPNSDHPYFEETRKAREAAILKNGRGRRGRRRGRGRGKRW